MITPATSLRVLFRKLNPVLSTLLVTATACALQAAPATTAQWQQTGWGGGGYFYCAAYHPAQDGVIYMGGDVAGVYKTTDSGRNWRMINNGIAAYGVFSLAVDRRNPQTVYAATEEGLCKSINGGESWVTLPKTGKKELRLTGEKGKSVRSIAVDPSNGNILYAANPVGKVYKSIDGGQTWALSYEKPAPTEDAGVLRLQYGKVNGAYFGDLWFQTAFPAGANAADCTGIGFTLKGDGSKPKDSFLIIKTRTGVAYRSKNLNTLYQDTAWRDIVLTAADFALDPDYAKKNPDAVASYTGPDWASIVRIDLPCSGPLPTEATVSKIKKFFFAFAPAATGGQTPLSTILDFSVPDAVKSVQVLGNLRIGAPVAAPISGIAVSSANPAWVVAATRDTGLILSKDAGRTWTELPTPKKAASATFDPANPNIIYGAFFTDGVHKSTDGGRTWTSLSSEWKAKTSILEVAVSPANPLDVYAISNLNWAGIVYRSNDGGKTWKSSSQIPVDLTANPTLDGLNAGTASLSAPTNITLNPRNPKELFVSANWRNVLSADGGATWLHRERGADISCATDIRFHKGKTYVTNMDEGTLVSEDHGKSWRQLWPLKHETQLSGHNWRVAINEINGAERVLVTSSPWGGLPVHTVRSTDAGKTFNVIKTGLPDYLVQPNTMWGQGYPRALAVDPNNPQTVYLGIDGDPAGGKMGGGVFKSADGGVTWNQLPNQPGSRRMYFGLAVDPTDSKRVFWGACGDKGGLYRSSDSGASWEKVFSNENWIWNVLVTADGTIYCTGQQLWRSIDHGKSWQQVTRFTEKWRVLVGLEVHPRDPKTIWVSATVWDNSANGAIYKTTDGGATWTDITGNIPYIRPQILRFNPATNELWAGYVGLYKIKQ
ncbi:MAG: hypothetical protein WC661_17585 [Opitutaceae bacterium]|jgi:photosystem II stability/assembly factor-like uncharacterized protein